MADLIGRRDEDHPDAQTLAQLLESDMDAAEREKLMLHLERCRSCARAVAVAMEQPAPRRRVPRVWLSLAAGFAAVAVTLTVLLQVPGDSELELLRNPGIEIQPGHRTTLDEPPQQFQWRAVDSTQPLRVRLMDAAAETIWNSQLVTADHVPAPVSVLSTPGTYLWQIENGEGTVVAGPFWFELK